MSLGRYAEALLPPRPGTSALHPLTTRATRETHQAIPIPHPGLPLPATLHLHGLHDLSAPGFDPPELFASDASGSEHLWACRTT